MPPLLRSPSFDDDARNWRVLFVPRQVPSSLISRLQAMMYRYCWSPLWRMGTIVGAIGPGAPLGPLWMASSVYKGGMPFGVCSASVLKMGGSVSDAFLVRVLELPSCLGISPSLAVFLGVWPRRASFLGVSPSANPFLGVSPRWSWIHQ